MSIGGAARIYAWPGAGSLRLGDSWLVGRRRTSREKHPDLLNLASLCKTAVGTPEGVVKAKATATSVSSAVHFSFQEPVCAGPLPSPSSDPYLILGPFSMYFSQQTRHGCTPGKPAQAESERGRDSMGRRGGQGQVTFRC